MHRPVVLFIVVLCVGLFGGHFIFGKPWMDALLTAGKAVIGHGFFTDNADGKFNTGIFWVVVIAGSIIWAYNDAKDGRLARLRSVDIVCAKCDQYLGNAAGFDCPCPRCGSNRYTRE